MMLISVAGKFWLIIVVSFLITSPVYLLVPWLRKPLVRENNVLELVTALLFLTVCVLGVKYLMNCGATYAGKVYWSIPLLGLMGFLEETSFGHSFLYYEVPVIEGVKIDALHDFLAVIVRNLQSSEMSLSLVGLTTGIGVLFLYFLFRFQLYDYRWYVKLFSAYPPLKFVGLCIGFLVLAALLDLELVSHHFWVFLEEFLESAASLALLFAYLAIRKDFARC